MSILAARNKQLSPSLVRFNDGDHDALVDMVEVERPYVFDFLFRMCGQRDAVTRVLDETVVALRADNSLRFNAVEDFYVAVYATARSFCSHIWNADTSELVNEGYANLDPEVGTSARELELVEKTIARIPSWEREPILLKVRSGFSYETIARIMSNSPTTVQEGYTNAVIKIASVGQNAEPKVIEHLVLKIPFFSAESSSHPSTVALSQLMQDIDRVKTGVLPSKWLIALGVLGVVLAIYLVFRWI